jgi:hypothetical protein
MSERVDGLEVKTQRKGDGGYIQFTHEENSAQDMEDQPNRVKLEYGSGYALVGMSDRYTIRMLSQEFCMLIGEDRSIYPSIRYQRLTDGTVVHKTVSDWRETEGLVGMDIMLDFPARIQEDAGRGTEIILRSDQLGVLHALTQAEQSALVGVSLQLASDDYGTNRRRTTGHVSVELASPMAGENSRDVPLGRAEFREQSCQLCIQDPLSRKHVKSLVDTRGGCGSWNQTTRRVTCEQRSMDHP